MSTNQLRFQGQKRTLEMQLEKHFCESVKVNFSKRMSTESFGWHISYITAKFVFNTARTKFYFFQFVVFYSEKNSKVQIDSPYILKLSSYFIMGVFSESDPIFKKDNKQSSHWKLSLDINNK